MLSIGKTVLTDCDIFATIVRRTFNKVLDFRNVAGLTVGAIAAQIVAVNDDSWRRSNMNDCSWYVPHYTPIMLHDTYYRKIFHQELHQN